MKERIVNKMIDFYKGNRSDVRHFLKVYAYAQTIGRLEDLDEKTQDTLEIAAIVHGYCLSALPGEVREYKRESSGGGKRRSAENISSGICPSGRNAGADYLPGDTPSYIYKCRRNGLSDSS